MVAEKCLPSLGRRSPLPSHVLGNRRLPDIDAKLKEFAMDPGCAPKRVRDTHLSNELPNLQPCLWPAALRSRLPPPIRAETGAMPTDNGLWSNNCQGAQHTRSQTIQPGKERPHDISQRASLE